MGSWSNIFNTNSLQRSAEKAVGTVIDKTIAGATGTSEGTVRQGRRGNIDGVIRGVSRDRERANAKMTREETYYRRAEDRYDSQLKNAERYKDRNPDHYERQVERAETNFQRAQERYVQAYIERYGEPPKNLRQIGRPEEDYNQPGQRGAPPSSSAEARAPSINELELNDQNRVRPGQSGADIEGDYVSAAAQGEINFGDRRLSEVNGRTYCTTVANEQIASFDVTDQMGGQTPEATLQGRQPQIDLPGPG